MFNKAYEAELSVLEVTLIRINNNEMLKELTDKIILLANHFKLTSL